jgi:uncharacterized glyoxalase superfamily protein PhnB
MLNFFIPGNLQNYSFMEKNYLTIPVENVYLAINYYKEYLGFKLINISNNNGIIKGALVRFNNTNILLEKINIQVNKQNLIHIQLNFSEIQMKKLFNEVKEKVRVRKSFNKNEKGINSFAIEDCDGNILNFSGCLDYQLEAIF